jgi:hypothetical protein
LRYSAALNSAELFNSIVMDGALSANGMVSFKTALTSEEVDSIRAYVVSRAIEAKKNGTGGSFLGQQRSAVSSRATSSTASGQALRPERASAKTDASH